MLAVVAVRANAFQKNILVVLSFTVEGNLDGGEAMFSLQRSLVEETPRFNTEDCPSSNPESAVPR